MSLNGKISLKSKHILRRDRQSAELGGRKSASRVVGADIITYTYNGDGLRTSKLL